MSHEATNWAIKQRGIAPAAKIVLWHLCDRFNRELGCFAGQELLTEDCEMSRSALNEHLAALEEAGLVKRERRFDARTKRRRSTRYRFPFEPGWPFRELHEESAESSHDPCPDSGHGAMSGNDPEPCPDSAESHVRNPDTNPVREPGREPIEREGGRASGQEEAAAADPEFEDQIDALGREHPTGAYDDPVAVRELFAALGRGDRREAVRLLPAWRDAQPKTRKVAPSLPQYLKGKLWRLLPPALTSKRAARAEARAQGHFNAFSREWAWVFFQRLAADPNRARMMWGNALSNAIGATIEEDQIEDITAAARAFVSVSVTSDGFAAWRRWMLDRGIYTFRRPDATDFVWLPSEWPPGAEGETATADERSEV